NDDVESAIRQTARRKLTSLPSAAAWGGWRWRYLIQGPTGRTFELIEERLPDHLNNRVDPAIDLSAISTADAWRRQLPICHYLDRPMHVPSSVAWRGGTFFLRYLADAGDEHEGGGWRGMNIVIYSDLPSKIDGRPVVHIELRYC